MTHPAMSLSIRLVHADCPGCGYRIQTRIAARDHPAKLLIVFIIHSVMVPKARRQNRNPLSLMAAERTFKRSLWRRSHHSAPVYTLGRSSNAVMI